jgi:hypothetical protein
VPRQRLDQSDAPLQRADANAAGPAHDEPVPVLDGLLAAVHGVAGSTHGKDVRRALDGNADVFPGWVDVPLRGGASGCTQAGIGQEQTAARQVRRATERLNPPPIRRPRERHLEVRAGMACVGSEPVAQQVGQAVAIRASRARHVAVLLHELKAPDGAIGKTHVDLSARAVGGTADGGQLDDGVVLVPQDDAAEGVASDVRVGAGAMQVESIVEKLAAHAGERGLGRQGLG